MKTSLPGLQRIEEREGERLVEYVDDAGLPTIGVGHCLTKDEWRSGAIHIGPASVVWSLGLTQEQVDDLLAQDVVQAERAVSQVRVTLTQNQFDSLVSFVFNIGNGNFLASTLLRQLNAGNYDAVPAQLRLWNKSREPGTGKLVVNAKLVKRREDEAAQWEATDDEPS